MEKIRRFVNEKKEIYRANKQAQQEKNRQERLQNHAHELTCTHTGDIVVVNQKQVVHESLNDHPFNPVVMKTVSNTTECTDCHKQETHFFASRITEYADVKDYRELPPAVVTGIVECVRQAFGSAPADTAQHISGDQLFTIERRQQIAAFSSTVFASPQEVFGDESLSAEAGAYFAAATVAEQFQQKGLYSELNEKRLGLVIKKRLPTLFTRTQNPNVEAALVTALQELCQRKMLSGFELNRTLVPGAYGSMLTEQKPTTKHGAIQQVYDSLNYADGDAYILEFSLEYPEKSTR